MRDFWGIDKNRALSVLQRLADCAPEHLYRYGMDWIQQKDPISSLQDWEEREPGSLKAVMKAYAYVIPIIKSNRRFTLEDIKTIHKYCTQEVNLQFRDSSSFEKVNLDSYAGVFRGFGPPLLGSVTGGFRTDVKDFVENDPSREEDDPSRIAELMRFQENEKICTFFNYNLDGTANTFESAGYLTIFGYTGGFSIDEMVALDQRLKSPIEKTDADVQRWRDNFILKLQSFLDEFYQALNDTEKTGSDYEIAMRKLSVIVRLIKRLELFHPFFDGNTRTFCMVLLNALLIQQGFLPTLLDDPNRFDSYTINELCLEVTRGMARTALLFNFVSKPSFSQNKMAVYAAMIASKNEDLVWLGIFPDHIPGCIECAEPLVAILQNRPEIITDNKDSHSGKKHELQNSAANPYSKDASGESAESYCGSEETQVKVGDNRNALYAASAIASSGPNETEANTAQPKNPPMPC